MPSTDAGKLEWSSNFVSKIVASPIIFGLTAPLATEFQTLANQFSSAYATAMDPTTRTTANISLKDEARAAMVSKAFELSKIVQGTSTVTDAQKIELRLNVKKSPSPIPVPDMEPEVDVISVTGRTVKMRFHNDVLDRAKPFGCASINVLTFLGEEPPADSTGWTLQGTSGRTTVTINFPAGDATTAWVTAFWVNTKGQYGPGCQPVRINLPATVVVPGAVAMKAAA